MDSNNISPVNKMKKYLNIIISIVILIIPILFNSCDTGNINNEPSPVACLSTSKTSVMVGETFTVKNCSSGKSFLWEDGDNYEVEGYENQERTVVYNNEGTYYLKITAYNSDKSIKSTEGKWITVTKPLGKVIFWQNGNPPYDITKVTINGISEYITSDYNSAPTDCTANGCAKFELKPGTYSFTATDGSYNWNGSVTVLLGGCTKLQLQ